MCFPMPIRNFKWLSQEEVANFNILDIDPLVNEGQGYILEVDLEYPPELHLAHSQFVLAPEQITITEQDLSESQKMVWSVLNEGKTYKPTTKLSATFRPRKQYVIHAACLKLYLGLGMKLKKIYRIMSFFQSRFIKDYIDVCTTMRSQASNKFEEKNIKTAACSIYGKRIRSM